MLRMNGGQNLIMLKSILYSAVRRDPPIHCFYCTSIHYKAPFFPWEISHHDLGIVTTRSPVSPKKKKKSCSESLFVFRNWTGSSEAVVSWMALEMGMWHWAFSKACKETSEESQMCQAYAFLWLFNLSWMECPDTVFSELMMVYGGSDRLLSCQINVTLCLMKSSLWGK